MDDISISNRFRSILYVLIHFSCSIIELCCILALLGLQITLTITETCAYHIAVGFWSFPFLLLSPINIWLLMWKRNAFFCFLTFIAHICSTLFTTAIIIVSFVALIQPIDILCSTSSKSNSYFLSINISLIAVSAFLKLIFYIEIILIYMLKRYTYDSSSLSENQFNEKNYQIISENINVKSTIPFKSIINKSQNNIKNLDLDI